MIKNNDDNIILENSRATYDIDQYEFNHQLQAMLKKIRNEFADQWKLQLDGFSKYSSTLNSEQVKTWLNWSELIQNMSKEYPIETDLKAGNILNDVRAARERKEVPLIDIFPVIKKFMNLWIVIYDNNRDQIRILSGKNGHLRPDFEAKSQLIDYIVSSVSPRRDTGSTGLAFVRKQALCLGDTSLDPKGNIAIEDIFLGNFSYISVPIIVSTPKFNSLTCHLGVFLPIPHIWTNEWKKNTLNKSMSCNVCAVKIFGSVAKKWSIALGFAINSDLRRITLDASKSITKKFKENEDDDWKALLGLLLFENIQPSPLRITHSVLFDINNVKPPIIAISKNQVKRLLYKQSVDIAGFLNQKNVVNKGIQKKLVCDIAKYLAHTYDNIKTEDIVIFHSSDLCIILVLGKEIEDDQRSKIRSFIDFIAEVTSVESIDLLSNLVLELLPYFKSSKQSTENNIRQNRIISSISSLYFKAFTNSLVGQEQSTLFSGFKDFINKLSRNTEEIDDCSKNILSKNLNLLNKLGDLKFIGINAAMVFQKQHDEWVISGTCDQHKKYIELFAQESVCTVQKTLISITDLEFLRPLKHQGSGVNYDKDCNSFSSNMLFNKNNNRLLVRISKLSLNTGTGLNNIICSAPGEFQFFDSLLKEKSKEYKLPELIAVAIEKKHNGDRIITYFPKFDTDINDLILICNPDRAVASITWKIKSLFSSNSLSINNAFIDKITDYLSNDFAASSDRAKVRSTLNDITKENAHNNPSSEVTRENDNYKKMLIQIINPINPENMFNHYKPVFFYDKDNKPSHILQMLSSTSNTTSKICEFSPEEKNLIESAQQQMQKRINLRKKVNNLEIELDTLISKNHGLNHMIRNRIRAPESLVHECRDIIARECRVRKITDCKNHSIISVDELLKELGEVLGSLSGRAGYYTDFLQGIKAKHHFVRFSEISEIIDKEYPSSVKVHVAPFLTDFEVKISIWSLHEIIATLQDNFDKHADKTQPHSLEICCNPDLFKTKGIFFILQKNHIDRYKQREEIKEHKRAMNLYDTMVKHIKQNFKSIELCDEENIDNCVNDFFSEISKKEPAPGTGPLPQYNYEYDTYLKVRIDDENEYWECCVVLVAPEYKQISGIEERQD